MKSITTSNGLIMYIVIIGCGKLGSRLAYSLSSEGHDVAVIDKQQENLDLLGTGFNGQRIKGVEFDTDILSGAGIDKADIFLAMTRDDNINIMASQVAKEIFRVPRVIARVYDTAREYVYRKLGIETINPTELSADIVKSRVMEKGTDLLLTLDSNLDIVEIPVLNDALRNVRYIEHKYNCRICSIFRKGQFSLSREDDDILAGDKIICTINSDFREKLVKDSERRW